MNGESVFLALGELEEDLIREARERAKPVRHPRRAWLLAAAVLLLALLAAAGYASPAARRFFTATGDEITVLSEGDRALRSGGEAVCVVRDGRILFLCDGTEKDITEECGPSRYFAWERTYEDGTRHLIAVGGTPERMGYFYVYLFPDGSGAFDLPCFYDYRGAAWVEKAVRDLGLEDLGISDCPDHGDLKVPTAAELIEHGYPVNSRGETYGPGGRYTEWLGQPDLELAMGKNGAEGYIRYAELEEASGAGRVHSPEEALAWNEYVRQRGPVEIPVYKEDGETVVDWFVISPGRAAEG